MNTSLSQLTELIESSFFSNQDYDALISLCQGKKIQNTTKRLTERMNIIKFCLDVPKLVSDFVYEDQEEHEGEDEHGEAQECEEIHSDNESRLGGEMNEYHDPKKEEACGDECEDENGIESDDNDNENEDADEDGYEEPIGGGDDYVEKEAEDYFNRCWRRKYDTLKNQQQLHNHEDINPVTNRKKSSRVMKAIKRFLDTIQPSRIYVDKDSNEEDYIMELNYPMTKGKIQKVRLLYHFEFDYRRGESNSECKIFLNGKEIRSWKAGEILLKASVNHQTKERRQIMFIGGRRSYYSFYFICICCLLSRCDVKEGGGEDRRASLNEYQLDPLITNLLENHFEEPWRRICYEWKERNNVSCEKSSNFYEESGLAKRSLTLIENRATKLVSSLNFLRFHEFISKFTETSSTEDDIVIAVLGGSMTAGRAVGTENAWPAKLQELLTQELLKRHRNITAKVLNLATPATSLLWVLNRLGPTLPNDVNIDLVIVDYDVNDCAFMYDDKISRIRVQSATELAIRKVLSLVHPVNNSSPLKGPAIAFSNVAINHQGGKIHMECETYPTCYSIGDIRNVIASAYAVPVISQKYSLYQDVVCDPPGNLWPCSRVCSHPVQGAHNLMANLFMKYFIGTSYQSIYNWEGETLSWGKKMKFSSSSNQTRKSSVEDHVYVQNMLASYPNYRHHLSIPGTPILEETRALEEAICSRVGTMYDSVQLFQQQQEHPSSQRNHLVTTQEIPGPVKTNRIEMQANESLGIARSNSSCWDLSEDVVGKAGWITLGEGCVNSTITFAVSFGEHPVLSISYLTSYTMDMGMVELRISKVPVRYDPIIIQSTNPSTFPPKEIIFTKYSQLLEYIHNEDNFQTIEIIDSLRADNEYFKLSVSEVIVVIPQDGRPLMQRGEFKENLLPKDWMVSNVSYFVQMKSIDANEERHRPKKVNGAIRHNSKFKLYSVSSC
jgi:hypothetical protein